MVTKRDLERLFTGAAVAAAGFGLFGTTNDANAQVVPCTGPGCTGGASAQAQGGKGGEGGKGGDSKTYNASSAPNIWTAAGCASAWGFTIPVIGGGFTISNPSSDATMNCENREYRRTVVLNSLRSPSAQMRAMALEVVSAENDKLDDSLKNQIRKSGVCITKEDDSGNTVLGDGEYVIAEDEFRILHSSPRVYCQKIVRNTSYPAFSQAAKGGEDPAHVEVYCGDMVTTLPAARRPLSAGGEKKRVASGACKPQN